MGNKIKVVENRFVCIYDILGFSKLIENTTIEKVVDMYAGRFQTLLEVLYDDFFKTILDLPVNYRVFSDTIVVFSDGGSNKELHSVLTAADILMARSFDDGFPLRGAIVFDECAVTDKVVFGKAIVKAYKMEQCQEWSGVWIDSVLVDLFKSSEPLNEFINNQVIVQYDVPLKHDPVSKKWVINWPTSCGLDRQDDDKVVREKFLKHHKNTELTWDVERKIANTEHFVRYIKSIKKQ